MARPVVSPFVGQWQCQECSRTFSRWYKLCPYCPTGDVVMDDVRRLDRELLIAEGKVDWAIVKQATVRPPPREVPDTKQEVKRWKKPTKRRG